MSVNGKTQIKWVINELLDSPELKANASGAHTLDESVSWTDGTASATDVVDLVWSDQNTVTASATNTIDLGTGGGLTDMFGTSIVPFVEVVGIFVKNVSTTAGDILHIGPHSSNGLTGPWVAAGDLDSVYPGGVWCAWNSTGWTVTDGSVDTVRIIETGGANTVTYKIVIIGRSA